MKIFKFLKKTKEKKQIELINYRINFLLKSTILNNQKSLNCKTIKKMLDKIRK